MNWPIGCRQALVATYALHRNGSVGCSRLHESSEIVQTDWTIRSIKLKIACQIPQLDGPIACAEIQCRQAWRHDDEIRHPLTIIGAADRNLPIRDVRHDAAERARRVWII